MVLKQPDLGTSIVFVAVLITVLYWSGLPATYMLLLITPVVSLIASYHWISWVVFFVLVLVLLQMIKPGTLFSIATISVNLLSGMIMPLIWNRLQDYQKMRILVFLDPGRDPLGAGYQIIQSKVAVGSGGLWGKGYMAGTQTNLAFIPERHTDFVFSVIGEEFGFWGGLLILIAFAGIILLGIQVALKCRNRFSSFVVIGGVTIIAFQLAVNVGMALGLMPVTGLPLPFISYGGSSLLMSWMILGLIVNSELNWQEY
jgi:rod shape determining protein RodA